MVQIKNLPEDLTLTGAELFPLQDPDDSDITKHVELDVLEAALEVAASNVQDAAWTAGNVVKLRADLATDIEGQVYADPQDALDYILAQSPSENDPWVLEFGAGVWDVSGLDISGVPRLTIRGQSKQLNQTWTATPGTRLKVSSGYLFDEISTPVLISNCHITLDGGTAVLGLSASGAYFNEVAFELGAAGQIYGDTDGANNVFFRCFFEGAAHLVQTHGDTFVDCDFNSDTPGEGIRLQTGDAAGRRVFNLYGCRRLPNAAASRPFFYVSNLNDDCTVRLVDCDLQDASGSASDYVNAPAGGTTTLEIRKTALGGAQINGAVVIDGQDLTATGAAAHTQGTDLGLDTGGDNPITAETLTGHVDLLTAFPGSKTVLVDPNATPVTGKIYNTLAAAMSYMDGVATTENDPGLILLANGRHTISAVIPMASGYYRIRGIGKEDVNLHRSGISYNFTQTELYMSADDSMFDTSGGSVGGVIFENLSIVHEDVMGGNYIFADGGNTYSYIALNNVHCRTFVPELFDPNISVGNNIFAKNYVHDSNQDITLPAVDTFWNDCAFPGLSSDGFKITNTEGARTHTFYKSLLPAVAGLFTESGSTQATTLVFDNLSVEPGAVELITAATANVTLTLKNGSKLNGNTYHANVTLNDTAVLSEVLYTPGNGADWTDPDPTTVQEALDRIAAAIGPIA